MTHINIMGVPGFFVWLMKHNFHNNIVLNKLENVNNLFFDANCLFHPKCFDILKLHSDITDINKLEKLMIKRILKYMQYIIDYVNPNNKIYIAVDGVAPVAKINQQRKRRYKSVIEKEYNEQLNKKYNINKNTSWSNIVITPGTDFMKKLDKEIIDYFKSNKKVIYSSYKECGEGEHKIARYIKQNKSKKNVIYGLDADLIFLSIATHTTDNEIYLLRELQHLKNVNQPITEDVSEPLCYVSIQNVIDTYNDYILDKIKEDVDYLELDVNNKYDFSKDFIILCFMLGNDFVPNIPSINIRNNGIEYITDAYCKAFKYIQENIYVDNKINWDKLNLIFDYLSSFEHEYFSEVHNTYKNKLKHKKCIATNEYEIQLWKHDNLKDICIDDKIQLGKGELNEYKFRYYEHNLHSRTNQQNTINKSCKNYLEMIEWITKYYFDIEMPSWQYCYYFDCSPFVSDLNTYLKNNKIVYNVKYEKPIDMKTQLLCVIPKYYKNMLKEYKVDTNKFEDKKSSYMFPLKYQLDYENKDMYWMCEVKLPIIDFDKVK